MIPTTPARPGPPQPTKSRVAPRRQLCLPTRPLPAETLRSYLSRLAQRNYLKPALLPHLARQPDFRCVLAELTGYPERHLASALPELRTQSDLTTWPHLIGTVSAQARIRPACALCVAARVDKPRPIPVFASHDQLFCATHCRWLGNHDLACRTRDQFSISDCPDLFLAHRAHTALIRQWGRGPVRASFDAANWCLSVWSDWPVVLRTPDIRRRRQRLGITDDTPWHHPKVVAATYPNAVALTRVILMQRQQIAGTRRLTADIDAAGIAEFQRHVIPGFEPHGACDPYRQAILGLQLEPGPEIESASVPGR